MVLSDKVIRKDLVDFLRNRTPRPKAVIDELRLHNGNAIADVVAVYQNAHCYEIKGENDTLNRMSRQAEYYNTTFSKISLVTTSNHITSAIKIIPDFWGILIAQDIGNKVTFSYLRRSKYNPQIVKPLALSILWKSELESIAKDINDVGLAKRSTRSQLADFIAKHKSKDGVVNDISLSILNRYNNHESSWPTNDK